MYSKAPALKRNGGLFLDSSFRKIDNCGSSTNVSHWAELLNATGKAIRTMAAALFFALMRDWWLVSENPRH